MNWQSLQSMHHFVIRISQKVWEHRSSNKQRSKWWRFCVQLSHKVLSANVMSKNIYNSPKGQNKHIRGLGWLLPVTTYDVNLLWIGVGVLRFCRPRKDELQCKWRGCKMAGHSAMIYPTEGCQWVISYIKSWASNGEVQAITTGRRAIGWWNNIFMKYETYIQHSSEYGGAKL